MIREILKWIGIVLGSLIGLLVLAFIVLYAIGSAKWNRIRGNFHDVPVEMIAIPIDRPPTQGCVPLQARAHVFRPLSAILRCKSVARPDRACVFA